MTDHNINQEHQHDSGGKKVCLEFIQKKVDQINLMANLLYEIKAGTPLGRVTVILLNLYFSADGNPASESPGVHSLPALAGLAGVSEGDLSVALCFLQQKGILSYRLLP